MVERPLVYVLEPIASSAVATLRQSCDVIDADDPARIRWHEDADGLIVRTGRIPRELIAAAPRLKVIGKHGVGVDNIDLDAARDRGVVVVSTPGANANAVAELSVGLALSVARRIAQLDRMLRDGSLDGPPPRGTELTGRTVGVVGMGSIGRRTAALFRSAFGAPILGYDPFAAEDAFREAGAERCATLEELLPRVDVLTLHIPLSRDTEKMIDARRLSLMRPEAMVLNLSRGGIVDETALRDALAGGTLSGAATDVFVEEPPPRDHPLLALPNFVATPHIGAATAESMERMGMAVVSDVAAVLAGAAPRHRVV
ncbi:hydroxyacid dehydrogenase [Skermanella rosea]|uniref:hydroxyacid dehydrogenase n=1 Tax=Skermanella rosea TaxID=1817965 RepID=UPI00193254EF|nr:hydroxyacid dehydrogenase [Skermanella rosea]UEM04917.1 hydroxyacid dehydrogenase [Skermanella rosea]